ncbi:MAG: diacylglycerol kinase family lipid kinase [Candidatus Eremiobacteraeota bacterium]|nr:diacylglycerol kinase family lipid kinase [Candidatus Eremiobacteraeota bacterium]
MLMIHNPVAGFQDDQLRQRLRAALEAHGGVYRATTGPEEATELARQLRPEHLVVAGGDDTIREVLAGVDLEGTTLGIVPVGTFNNVAHSLGLPVDPLQALEVAVNGRFSRVDLGLYNGSQLFVESAGMGFVADVFERAQSPEGHGLKRWVQGGVAAAAALLEYAPTSFELEVDGQPLRFEAADLTVANLPLLGTNLPLAPQARADDGRLDVCVVPRCSRLELVKTLPAALAGEHEVIEFKARRVVVRPRQPQSIRIDARVTDPVRQAEFVCLPGALRVRLP